MKDHIERAHREYQDKSKNDNGYEEDPDIPSPIPDTEIIGKFGTIVNTIPACFNSKYSQNSSKKKKIDTQIAYRMSR